MFKFLISATKTISCLTINRPSLLYTGPQCNIASTTFQRCFSLVQPKISEALFNNNSGAINSLNMPNTRTVTKYSIRKGKRKTVQAVPSRFYRLNWGMWIRRIAGAHKKLWKKSPPQKRRLRQHVFCNATQSRLLDKMVNNYWRRPKYYVDDPYEPYHAREEFQFTYKKPRPYFPPGES